MATIKDCFLPASRAQIRGAAEALGCTLPADYEKHLLGGNGGYPVPADFTIGQQGATSTVHYFLGIAPDDRDDLVPFNRSYAGRLPADTLAIAYDPLGNLICLVVQGTREGEVVFWDHEAATCDLAKLRTIASSFSEFVEGLHG